MKVVGTYLMLMVCCLLISCEKERLMPVDDGKFTISLVNQTTGSRPGCAEHTHMFFIITVNGDFGSQQEIEVHDNAIYNAFLEDGDQLSVQVVQEDFPFSTITSGEKTVNISNPEKPGPPSMTVCDLSGIEMIGF